MRARYVKLEDVIGETAYEYGWPVLEFDNIIALGKKAVQVYGLQDKYRKITFEVMCEYITKYINTAFGRRVLIELINNQS